MRTHIWIGLALSASFIAAGCGGSGGTLSSNPTLLFFSTDISGLKVMRTGGGGRQTVHADTFVGAMDENGKVVTSIFDGTNDNVFIMDKDGSNAEQLTNSGSDDFRPNISPDGSIVVFISHRDGNYEIYKMAPDGSGQTRITNDGGTDYYPAVSIDGSKIAFTSTRDGGDEDVFVINSDGTGLQQITANASVDTTPAWTPDGRVIFSSNRNGTYELYTADADGSNVVQLTDDGVDKFHASFQVDGSHIYYYEADGPVRQIWRINPDGSGAKNISNNSISEDKICTWVY